MVVSAAVVDVVVAVAVVAVKRVVVMLMVVMVVVVVVLVLVLVALVVLVVSVCCVVVWRCRLQSGWVAPICPRLLCHKPHMLLQVLPGAGLHMRIFNFCFLKSFVCRGATISALFPDKRR